MAAVTLNTNMTSAYQTLLKHPGTLRQLVRVIRKSAAKRVQAGILSEAIWILINLVATGDELDCDESLEELPQLLLDLLDQCFAAE